MTSIPWVVVELSVTVSGLLDLSQWSQNDGPKHVLEQERR